MAKTVKVTFEHPSFPKGMEFAFQNYGVFPNGEEVEIDEDEFKDQFGITVRQALVGKKFKFSKTETTETPKASEGGEK